MHVCSWLQYQGESLLQNQVRFSTESTPDIKELEVAK